MHKNYFQLFSFEKNEIKAEVCIKCLIITVKINLKLWAFSHWFTWVHLLPLFFVIGNRWVYCVNYAPVFTRFSETWKKKIKTFLSCYIFYFVEVWVLIQVIFTIFCNWKQFLSSLLHKPIILILKIWLERLYVLFWNW